MNAPPSGPGTESGPRRLNRELIFLIAGIVVMTHATSMVTVPLLPRFITGLGGTVLGVGLALGIYAAARLITNIPAGVLSERWGRRKVIIAGALGVGVFASLSGTAASVPVFLAYRFMLGVFSSMAITISSVAITDVTTVENRGRTLSLVSGAHLVVGIAAPGLGGIVGEFVDIRVPFYASGIGALLVGVWAIARLPETRPARRHEEVEARAAATRPWSDARALLTNQSFLLVCIIGFAHFFTRTGASHTLIPLFADRVVDIGPAELGIFFSVASVIHGVMVYPAGVASDRWGRKVLLVPGGVLTALALVYFPFTGSLVTFGIAFIAVHTASGFSGGAPNAYVGDASPPAMRGLGFGIFRTFGDLAGVIAPITLAWVATTSFHAGFFFAAALILGATLAFAWLAAETAGSRARRSRSGARVAAPEEQMRADH